MIKKILVFLIAMIFSGCYVQEKESATKGKLNVQVSDGYLDLMQREINRFQELYPEAKVTAAPTSTREAIVNMLNDSINFILIDRAMNTEERQIYTQAKLAVQDVKIALDALILVVNADNSIKSISLENLKKVLLGEINDWKLLSGSNQSGEIEIAATGRNSGSYELVQKHLLNNADYFPDTVLIRQTDIISYTLKNLSALGVISNACYGTVRLTPDSAAIRVLSIGVMDSTDTLHDYYPYQAYIYNELYPLHYPVYVYIRSDKSDLALGFSSFIASATGQKIILNYGLVPATQPVRLVQITQEQM